MKRHLLEMVLVMEIGISHSSMPTDLAFCEFLYDRTGKEKQTGEEQ
jgi:hypothetical protein